MGSQELEITQLQTRAQVMEKVERGFHNHLYIELFHSTKSRDDIIKQNPSRAFLSHSYGQYPISTKLRPMLLPLYPFSITIYTDLFVSFPTRTEAHKVLKISTSRTAHQYQENFIHDSLALRSKKSGISHERPDLLPSSGKSDTGDCGKNNTYPCFHVVGNVF